MGKLCAGSCRSFVLRLLVQATRMLDCLIGLYMNESKGRANAGNDDTRATRFLFLSQCYSSLWLGFQSYRQSAENHALHNIQELKVGTPSGICLSMIVRLDTPRSVYVNERKWAFLQQFYLGLKVTSRVAQMNLT